MAGEGSYEASYSYSSYASSSDGGGSYEGGGSDGGAEAEAEAEAVCRSDGWLYYSTYVGGDDVVNPYALGWPVCSEFEQAAGYMQRFRLFSLLQASAGQRVVGNASSVPMRGGLYSPCGENFMEVYLNRADVRAALHVDHERRWSSCDDPVFVEYNQSSHDAPMQPIWTELVRGTDWEALGMAPLNVLIASGDNDAVCGVHGTQRWVLDLGPTR